MIDVVYPLANLSRSGDDWELRYSLRSLAQQKWVGRIFIVGHKPCWVKDVIHIDCADPYKHAKDSNIINKILLACAYEGLSDQFVINSDDHYILKPISLEDLGPWLENPNPMNDAPYKQKASLWHRRLVDTTKFCEVHNLPQWVFQCHIPYLVDKKKYVTAMSTVPWARGNGLLTHIYYNLALNERPVDEYPGHTLRVSKVIYDAQFNKLVTRATFLNHNNQGLCPAVKTYLERKFPEKSIWEM